MKTALAELLHHPLVWRGDQLAASLDTISTGFADLDSELPGGGWPKGALTELLRDGEGIGEMRLPPCGICMAGITIRFFSWSLPITPGMKSR